MVKPIRRSPVRALGRNIKDRRRAGLTQEQLAEYMKINALPGSRCDTGKIHPPTVVDMVGSLLNTTIADHLDEAPAQTVEHAERIDVWSNICPHLIAA